MASRCEAVNGIVRWICDSCKCCKCDDEEVVRVSGIPPVVSEVDI